MKNWELQVTGMHCSGCETRICNALKNIEGVKSVKANHKTGKVEITFHSELTEELKEKIKTQLEELEFKVEE